MYLLITGALSLTFNTAFLLVEKRNSRKNSCFWKQWWLTNWKISTTYLCVIYFFSSHFSLLIAVTVLFSVQDVASLMVYGKISRSSWPSICTLECCTTVSHIFTKTYRFKTGVNLVKFDAPFSTRFFFSLFLFYLLDCAHAQFYGKTKTNVR